MPMTKVSRTDSLMNYPPGLGCVYCGHDAAYLSTTCVGSHEWTEAGYEPPKREKVMKDGSPAPLCPSCAKGHDEPHHPECRGCR